MAGVDGSHLILLFGMDGRVLEGRVKRGEEG